MLAYLAPPVNVSPLNGGLNAPSKVFDNHILAISGKASGSALASGLSDLVDITVDTDTAACDVEVFVGSA